MLMHKEPIEYCNPEWLGSMNANLGLHSSYQYEQKPTESNTAVHISKYKIAFENLTMEETLHYSLPYSGKEFPRKNILLHL